MRHHSPFKRLGFALALVLCPVLTAGSIASAFAADVVIDYEVDSGSVYGNSDDNSGLNNNGSATGNSVHITGEGSVTDEGAGYVLGAADYTGTQDVSGNTVTMDTGSWAYGDVIGGEATGDKAATDNHVTVSAPDTGNVFGGGNWEGAGEVSGNSVTISGDGKVWGSAVGGHSETGVVSGNTVTVTGSSNADDGLLEFTWAIYGGEGGGDSAVTDNHVILNGYDIDIAESVYGGLNFNEEGVGAVNGNTVSITDSYVSKDVFGGTGYAQVSGNHVTLSGDAYVGLSVYGGRGDGDNSVVSGNTVTINGGTVDGSNIAGGWGIVNSIVSGNTVTINGGTINAAVHGGRGEDASEVSGNSVFINGGEISEDVNGARSSTGSATENSVTINGGEISKDVRGAYSTSGSATENSVTIQDGLVTGFFIGGHGGGGALKNRVTILGGEVGHVRGGFGGAGSTEENSVTMQDGVAESVIGGQGDADVLKNWVKIIGGEVTSHVYGGSSSEDGEASGNIVEISDASVGDSVFGGSSEGGAVTGNIVKISDSSVGSDIYGGSSEGAVTDNIVEISGGEAGGNIYGGLSTAAEANGNQIIINGATVAADAIITGGRGMTEAINNTVTIMGAVDLGPATSNTGARISGGSAGLNADRFTGNTFNLKSSGLSINYLAGFEYLNFYLPTDFEAGEAMLTVTSLAQLTENADGTGRSSIVNVGIDGNSSALQAGDSLVLIDANSLTTNDELNKTATGYGKQGSTLDYIFSLTTEDNKLVATVEDVSASEDSKVLSEGVVSGLALATQGSDLTAGEGLGQAVSAAAITGFGTFSAMGAGALKYDTGSSVDVNGFSLMAGLSFGNDLDAGRLTMGAFFEYGNGSYDTHNSFSGVNVDGGGDTDYAGGGLLGRMDFAESDSGHFYTEFSARMGRLSNDFKGSDSLRASYESSASYHGLHAGLGYVWNVGEKTFLDLYGKYLWTHQGGDSVKLSTGAPLDFEAADSHRVRVGGRLSYQANENIAPYVGAAYEHEFDGQALATTYGKAIDAPDMKGGTGIGELGFTLKPSQDSPVSFDLGLQGYTGLREGVTGSLQIKFEF